MLSAKSINGDGGGTTTRVRAAGHTEKPLAQLIVNGLVAITPELAHRVIQECAYDRQRTVRPIHVSAMAMQMRKKEWTPGTQIHFARMSDGWLRILDGQHRLHAVIESNAAIEFQVLVSDARNEGEVARLYRRHDRLSITRTVADTLRAEGILERHGLRANVAREVFKAALLIEARFEGVRSAKADPYLVRSDEARLRLCEPWWPIAAHFQDATTNAPRKIKDACVTQGALAVALLTLRDQETKADAFWRGLANNDGLRRDDPRAVYIRAVNVERFRTIFDAAKQASIAWNAFFHNDRLQLIRVNKSPVRIDGVKGI